MLGAVEIGRGQSPQGFANGGRHPEQSLMRRERLRYFFISVTAS